MSGLATLKRCRETLPKLGWCLIPDFQFLTEELLEMAHAMSEEASVEKAQKALTLIKGSRTPTEEEIREWKGLFKQNTDDWPQETEEWRYMKDPECKSLEGLLNDLVVAA